MQCRKLYPLPKVALLAGVEKMPQPLRMRRTQALGNDQLGHIATERFVAPPAEHSSGVVIPFGDLAVGAHDDDGVERGVQQQIERAFPWRARAHRSCASFYRKYSTRERATISARRGIWKKSNPDAPAPEVTFRNVVVTVCNTTLAAAERPRNGRVGSKASPALEPSMRKLPIAVAALALMTGAASAQTTNTSPRPAPGATTTAPMHKETAINPLTQDDVSKIEGTSVYGNDDGKIGHISTALMDPSSKKIDRLVVSAGGVLGVGGHRVAMPVEQFPWDADTGAFKLGTT